MSEVRLFVMLTDTSMCDYAFTIEGKVNDQATYYHTTDQKSVINKEIMGL